LWERRSWVPWVNPRLNPQTRRICVVINLDLTAAPDAQHRGLVVMSFPLNLEAFTRRPNCRGPRLRRNRATTLELSWVGHSCAPPNRARRGRHAHALCAPSVSRRRPWSLGRYRGAQHAPLRPPLPAQASREGRKSTNLFRGRKRFFTNQLKYHPVRTRHNTDSKQAQRAVGRAGGSKGGSGCGFERESCRTRGIQIASRCLRARRMSFPACRRGPRRDPSSRWSSCMSTRSPETSGSVSARTQRGAGG